MALRHGVDLRSLQPIPSPAHGRLVSTSSPPSPLTSTRPSSPVAGRQQPRASSISARPDSCAALAPAGPSSSSLAPGQPTEDDWWRFSAPKRGDAERGAPLRSTVPRQKVGRKRSEPAFKMVGEWRIGDSLGKGTGGASLALCLSALGHESHTDEELVQVRCVSRSASRRASTPLSRRSCASRTATRCVRVSLCHFALARSLAHAHSSTRSTAALQLARSASSSSSRRTRTSSSSSTCSRRPRTCASPLSLSSSSSKDYADV